jgi:hypothetical protein
MYAPVCGTPAKCRNFGQEEETSYHIIVNGKFWLGVATASEYLEPLFGMVLI